MSMQEMPQNQPEQEELYPEIYRLLTEAIQNHKRVLILYQNLKRQWKERYIHPIQIFEYDHHFYVTAFCELRNDIRHFEFSRMKIVE